MQDQWINKQLREGCFMPFGSMMNAYGQINKGKVISTKKFLDDSMLIFGQAQIMVRQAIINSMEEEIKQEKETIEPIRNEIPTRPDEPWLERKYHQDLMEDDDKADFQRNNK